MGWNIHRIDLRNVAVNCVIVREIGAIGLLSKPIPFTGEYAPAAQRFKTKSHTAYPCKQINESEGPTAKIPLGQGLERYQYWRLRRYFALFPPIDSATAATHPCSHFRNAESCLLPKRCEGGQVSVHRSWESRLDLGKVV